MWQILVLDTRILDTQKASGYTVDYWKPKQTKLKN